MVYERPSRQEVKIFSPYLIDQSCFGCTLASKRVSGIREIVSKLSIYDNTADDYGKSINSEENEEIDDLEVGITVCKILDLSQTDTQFAELIEAYDASTSLDAAARQVCRENRLNRMRTDSLASRCCGITNEIVR